MSVVLQQLNTIISILLSKWINTGDKVLDNTLIGITLVAISSLLYYISTYWIVIYNLIIFHLFAMHKYPINISNAPYILKKYKFENIIAFKSKVANTYSVLELKQINDKLEKNGIKTTITNHIIEYIINNIIRTNNIAELYDEYGTLINYESSLIYPIGVSNKGHIVYYILSKKIFVTSTGNLSDSIYIKNAVIDYIYNKIITLNIINDNNQIYITKASTSTIELKSIGPINKKKTFDTLFYPQKDELITILKKFQNKTMYPSHIPMDNKLGIILYGPPGTGKTGTVSAIANMLKRNLIVINFTSITTCKQLDEILDVNNYSNNIYVFDEFDCIMDVISGTPLRDKKEEAEDWGKMLLYAEGEERKSILEMMKQNRTKKDNSAIDLAYLLQKLDGLESAEDRIIIATTNNPEKLNPALMRPGRFDIKICLGLCTSSMVVDILTYFYKDDAKLREKIKKANIPGNKYSPLQLINMAIQASNVDKLLKKLSN